jgi:phage shock protein A
MFASFKRWSRAVVAGVDGLIVQVENHEAVVESGLRELEQCVARAKRELDRVKADGETLGRRRSEQQRAAIALREYAKREPVEALALDYLRKSKRSLRRSLELERRATEHERIEKRLVRDVRELEDQLAALREKRDAMQARKARSEAFDQVLGGSAAGAAELAGTLERWEAKVVASEIASGCPSVEIQDSIEDCLFDEDEAALALELRQLKECAW